MIKRNQKPETWTAPDWHADFGDARSELEELRCFAVALRSALPAAHAELETPEPGLMYLDVRMPDGSIAQVYLVAGDRNSGERRLGLFFATGTGDELEVYADSIDCAVRHFTAAAVAKSGR